MRNEVTVTELVEIDCPPEDALAVVWGIHNIEKTEVKVDSVQVLPQTEHTGTYRAHGSFAGVRWKNEFFYTLHDTGFHSVEAYPPPSGIRIHGGFVVVPTGPKSCLVLHYEAYTVPGWATLLRPLISLYLRWTMKKEMRDVRAMILARPAQAAAAPVT
jgi:hypothetical protein